MNDEPAPLDPFDSPEYKCHREDIDQAKTTRLEVFKIFASHTLAITGGLVAAIGYLIKEFKNLSHLWILLLAAGLATASLMAALFELVFSQVSTVHLESKLRKSYKNEDVTEDTCQLKYYGRWCTRLLYAIPWLILLAVIASGVFLAINIPNFQQGETTMSDEKKKDLIIEVVVTDAAERAKQPSERHIANIITDGPEKPKERSVPQEKKKDDGKPSK